MPGRIRALIWGKTYPELSRHYLETVCTGAVLPDGTPVRLYPVPLRYMDTDRQYSLYDWIEVDVARNRRDPRPESLRVYPDSMRITGHVDTNPGWTARAAYLFGDPRWQFESVAALKAEQRRSARSMGIVTPAEIVGVRLVRRPASEAEEFETRMAEIQGQADMFRPEYRELQFLPNAIKLEWRCGDADACRCGDRPHSMKVLDWGLLELARRDGWATATARLEEIANLRTHDFRLLMGNFKNRPWTFGVIGLWYPKRQPQITLL